MSFTVKIEQHGDDLFINLSEEAVTHLRAKVGDSLELVRTQDGLLLHYHDVEFSKQMAAARLGHGKEPRCFEKASGVIRERPR